MVIPTTLYKLFFISIISLLPFGTLQAQTNLLLNGGFEDVNTCTEYNSECGVEGWFYLKDVQAQMMTNDSNTTLLGNNSFGIFYKWLGYTSFSPVIGTILPCGLQKNCRYTFKGIISARLNAQLILKPGICVGERFYVPRRSFSKDMHPDSITTIHPIPDTKFFQFEFSFIADGSEKYLTFGTYIEEDTTGAKKKLIGVQTVSLVLDQFELIAENKKETYCADYALNKEKIYQYNFRHKEMDYSLFGKGELAIQFTSNDSNYITSIKEPAPILQTDTLNLGDVFFDSNKSTLKPKAIKMLSSYFITGTIKNKIDSLYVEGHTDSIGTENSNIELSLQRCESIRQWLVANNVATTASIQVHPFGESKPIASNNTPAGRALNRRVEMIVFRNPEN